MLESGVMSRAAVEHALLCTGRPAPQRADKREQWELKDPCEKFKGLEFTKITKLHPNHDLMVAIM